MSESTPFRNCMSSNASNPTRSMSKITSPLRKLCNSNASRLTSSMSESTPFRKLYEF